MHTRHTLMRVLASQCYGTKDMAQETSMMVPQGKMRRLYFGNLCHESERPIPINADGGEHRYGVMKSKLRHMPQNSLLCLLSTLLMIDPRLQTRCPSHQHPELPSLSTYKVFRMLSLAQSAVRISPSVDLYTSHHRALLGG